MGHHQGYFSYVLFKFCNHLLIKTKTNAVYVPVYIIREESVYVVHNMKNILVIIGICYSGSSLRPLFTPFIIFAPTTTQILVIKYFYVIDSI
jgi:hypothetical protein